MAHLKKMYSYILVAQKGMSWKRKDVHICVIAMYTCCKKPHN